MSCDINILDTEYISDLDPIINIEDTTLFETEEGGLSSKTSWLNITTKLTPFIENVVTTNLTTDDITEGITNFYDKVVSLTEGTNITITGTYPNFTINSSSGSNTFLGLTDTPSDYTGQAGKRAVVNDTEDAVIFEDTFTRTSLWTGSAGVSTITLSEDMNNYDILEITAVSVSGALQNQMISVNSFKVSTGANPYRINNSSNVTNSSINFHYATDTSITITLSQNVTLKEVVGLR